VTSTATPPANRTRAALTITAAILAVFIVIFFIFAGLYTDVLWFDQLGYLSVLTTQWTSIAVMFLVGFFGMAIPVYVSIEVAFRARPTYAKLNSQLDRYQQVIEPLRRLAMIGIPVVLGVFAGVSASTRWPAVLQYLNRTTFGEVDPQFGLDVSFFVFELPFYRGVVAFASAVVLIAGLAALATTYLYGAIRVAGREVRISRSARVQLAITASLYLLLQGVSIWLDQYTTLTATGDGFVATGASYTEANATIPGKAILAGIAAFVAILFIVTAVIGRWRLPVIGTALLVVSTLVIGSLVPWVVQTFQVNPNARTLEAEYIDRSIAATRDAYGVADVAETPYDAATDAEAGALREDAETTANIRIIDPALVSDSFAQLQRIRQFYQFAPNLDVDRYEIDGKTQDTVIAVRELNQDGLGDNRSWYNDAVVYTHGFGVVAAYGNQRTTDGQPVFLESEIPTVGDLPEFEPRVYFGESSPAYSIVGAPEGADPIELDYPASADEEDSSSNRVTTFDGNGGPKLDSILAKLVYAIKFQSQDIFLSGAVTDSSQILYERDPLDRVKKAAPYLTVDSDPYPAIVDGDLLWIVDAYTTTANYPYSTVQQLSTTIADTNTQAQLYPTDSLNYIRNSVKATVNAYNGEVTLYAWDDEDPLLETWQKIFPSTLKSADDMSADLLSHVRYPADLFKMQRSILGAYHVTDTNTFYSGTDQWVTPQDPTSPETLQPPYYLTMQLPGADEPAFTLYSSYIPRSSATSTSNNLTGYLAVNADAGEDYGKLTLLTLPSGDTVPGPGQVQNNFSSDTIVANQLAIIKQGDTDVLLGNLLTLPVGGGLLYVQPVYVQATGGTSYPLLRKVLVGFGDKIAFEDTLDLALDKLFDGDSGASAGDGETPVEPDPDPTNGGDDEEDPGTGTGTPSAALTAALADAKTALAARTAAYAANDLVAAAEADKDLTEALTRALAASGN